MITLKRFSLFFSLCLLAFACSKDEEVQPKQEEIVDPFEFNAQNPPIEIPAGLQNSSAPEAQMINSFIASANGITAYGGYFNIPENAEVSTTPITAANGRSAMLEDVKVYTYTYSGGGETVTLAYQLTETADYLKFEIFLEENGGGYYKFLEGQESKADARDGYLSWYAAEWGTDPVYTYTWQDNADGSFSMRFEGLDYLLTFEIAADGSGDISQYFDGNISAKYTWDAAGTGGTVTYYDSSGAVTETYNWTA